MYSEVKLNNPNYADDYFLSVLASLSDSSLKNIITSSSYSSSGAFGANIYIKGILTQVIVDDLLPVYSKVPIFAQISSKNTVWAALLEKVWAKVNGNYENIVDQTLTASQNSYYSYSSYYSSYNSYNGQT